MFAGGTVVIALVTLLIAGIPLVTSLGYASAVAVVTAVLAAITLLPALLSLVGEQDRLARAAGLHASPKPKPEGRGFWNRWALFVTSRPGRSIAIMLALLLVLMIPFFSLELGQEDIGATPKDTTERQSYDYISEGFGPGYTGPLLVAVNLGDEPATPSEEFEKQYAKAQSLQNQLEDEQATGEAGAESLQNSADELEAQEARAAGGEGGPGDQGRRPEDREGEAEEQAPPGWRSSGTSSLSWSRWWTRRSPWQSRPPSSPPRQRR